MTLRTVSSMSSFGSANDLKLLPPMGEPICLLDYKGVKFAAAHCSHHGRQCFNLRSANADDGSMLKNPTLIYNTSIREY